MMSKIYLLVPITTLLGSLGALFFKRASEKIKDLKSLILNIDLYIGGIFYVLGALLNIVLLKVLPYSIVPPLMSFTYVWTVIISKIVLKEKIRKTQIVGVVLLILGSTVIAM